MARNIVSWFEADCTSGSYTATFNDKMDIIKVSLRGYSVRGLNGTWPSTMKVTLKTSNGYFLGQSVQAESGENPAICMVVPVGDAAAAKWFDNPPTTGEYQPVQSRTLAVSVYESDGTTALTGTDIKLFFEVEHIRLS